VTVGGCHHLKVHGAAELDKLAVQPAVGVAERRLELDEKAIPAEYLAVACGSGAGPVRLIGKKRPYQIAAATAAEKNEPLVMLEEPASWHGGLVLPAPGVGMGDEFEQILVAPVVLGEEDHMARSPRGTHLAGFHRLAVVDPQLAPENRLDAQGIGLVIELDGAEEAAVVGEGKGG
jgi:hypothetical protein